MKPYTHKLFYRSRFLPSLQSLVTTPLGSVLLHSPGGFYSVMTYCGGLCRRWVVTTGTALAKCVSEDVQQRPVLPPGHTPRQRLHVNVAAGGTKGNGDVRHRGLGFLSRSLRAYGQFHTSIWYILWWEGFCFLFSPELPFFRNLKRLK